MAATTDARILDQRTPQERARSFRPGMGRTWLLPLYDVLSRVMGARALHERVAELAGIEPGQAVLDIGCGTANLSLAVLAAQPGARVTGLDPEGPALRRAARKARRRSVPLTLVHGYADRFPAEDASLDHVISSLALHHLDADGRAAFAREAFRALRPGGRVTVVDFRSPVPNVENVDHSTHAPGLRSLPRLMHTRMAHSLVVDHDRGDAVVALLAEAGFGDAQEVAHIDHRLGRVTFVQATRPMS